MLGNPLVLLSCFVKKLALFCQSTQRQNNCFNIPHATSQRWVRRAARLSSANASDRVLMGVSLAVQATVSANASAVARLSSATVPVHEASDRASVGVSLAAAQAKVSASTEAAARLSSTARILFI